MRLLFLVAALALAGCANAPTEPISVNVGGPKFPASAFVCKPDAIPPEPGATAHQGGSAAAGYEAAERAVAADCRAKLNAVGAQERAAGNIIEP